MTCANNLDFDLPAKAREYVFTGVGLCVFLSVTTITKKIVDGSFVPNFMGRFLGKKGRRSSCFVTIGIEGCGSNGQKLRIYRRLFTFTFYTSNSRCDKCCQVLATTPPQFCFRGELYSLTSSTFHLVDDTML